MTDVVIHVVEPDSPDLARLAAGLDAELEERYPGLGADGSGSTRDLTVAIVAYSEEVPVGCAALRELEPSVGEVTRLFVVPQGRRLGVARRLLEAIEAQGRLLGYSALRLGTGLRQPEAMALYESSGYSRIPLFGEYEYGPCACYEKALATKP